MIKKVAKLFESSNEDDWEIAMEILQTDDNTFIRFMAIMYLTGRTNPSNRAFDRILGIDSNSRLWTNVARYFEENSVINKKAEKLIENAK